MTNQELNNLIDIAVKRNDNVAIYAIQDYLEETGHDPEIIEDCKQTILIWRQQDQLTRKIIAGHSPVLNCELHTND